MSKGSFILAMGLLCAVAAQAQVPYSPRFPRTANSLAPYVPSPQPIVERMLELANLQPGEMLFDLGSGDGRVVIAAAQRYRVKAIGVEHDARLVQRASDKVRTLNLQDLVSFQQADLRAVDLGQADVVVIYLLTGSNDELRPHLERQLKPGCRVISHDYAVPGWKALRTERVSVFNRGHVLYLYEMPRRP